MEGRVDIPGQGDVNAICYWGNLFSDLEGSISFCHEFRFLMAEFEVLCLEEDFISEIESIRDVC